VYNQYIYMYIYMYICIFDMYISTYTYTYRYWCTHTYICRCVWSQTDGSRHASAQTAIACRGICAHQCNRRVMALHAVVASAGTRWVSCWISHVQQIFYLKKYIYIYIHPEKQWSLCNPFSIYLYFCYASNFCASSMSNIHAHTHAHTPHAHTHAHTPRTHTLTYAPILKHTHTHTYTHKSLCSPLSCVWIINQINNKFGSIMNCKGLVEHMALWPKNKHKTDELE